MESLEQSQRSTDDDTFRNRSGSDVSRKSTDKQQTDIQLSNMQMQSNPHILSSDAVKEREHPHDHEISPDVSKHVPKHISRQMSYSMHIDAEQSRLLEQMRQTKSKRNSTHDLYNDPGHSLGYGSDRTHEPADQSDLSIESQDDPAVKTADVKTSLLTVTPPTPSPIVVPQLSHASRNPDGSYFDREDLHLSDPPTDKHTALLSKPQRQVMYLTLPPAHTAHAAAHGLDTDSKDDKSSDDTSSFDVDVLANNATLNENIARHSANGSIESLKSALSYVSGYTKTKSDEVANLSRSDNTDMRKSDDKHHIQVQTPITVSRSATHLLDTNPVDTDDGDGIGLSFNDDSDGGLDDILDYRDINIAKPSDNDSNHSDDSIQPSAQGSGGSGSGQGTPDSGTPKNVDPSDIVDVEQMVELVNGSLDDPMEQYMGMGTPNTLDLMGKNIEDTSESMLAKKIFYDVDDAKLPVKDRYMEHTASYPDADQIDETELENALRSADDDRRSCRSGHSGTGTPPEPERRDIFRIDSDELREMEELDEDSPVVPLPVDNVRHKKEKKHIVYIGSDGRPVTKVDTRPERRTDDHYSGTGGYGIKLSPKQRQKTPPIVEIGTIPPVSSVPVSHSVSHPVPLIAPLGPIKPIPRVSSSTGVSGLGGFLTGIISSGASTIASAMGTTEQVQPEPIPVRAPDGLSRRSPDIIRPIKTLNVVKPRSDTEQQDDSMLGQISFDQVTEQRSRTVPIISLTKKRSDSIDLIESGDILQKTGTSPPVQNEIKRTADRLKKLNIESRRISKWVEDDSVGKCFNCHSEFSLMLRRHHCRLCGRVFCYYCSNYFTKLPLDILNKIPNRPQSFTDLIWGEDLNGTVRTCSSCYSHANKLIRIRKIIKVFELCQFTIKDLNVLSKLSVDWEDAAKFLLSKFREIQYKLSIEDLTQNEKRLLWINRNYLTGHSRWMVQLVKATDLDNDKSVLILEQLMYKKKMNKCWDIMCTRFCSETIGITDMLDLIRYNRNYSVISNFIVKCLVDMKVDTLKNYLPFLVYNIKNNEFILDILLDKGIDDFKFMSNLYWCIKVYCPDADVRKAHIVTTLVTIRDRSSKEFRRRFKEMVEMERLDIKWLHLLNEKKRIVLPICPETTFKQVDTQNVKIMSSYSQPAIITFIDEQGIRKPIMFKNDDVRKDYIVLNIINIIHDILRREEDDLDIEMVRYEVMPTSQNTGYIEIVENAATIFNIIENSGLTIQNFILNNNKDLMIGSFREKFIKSTALYCVVSYLLGIGDRHLDNIMISKNGLLFHIDFGFILGQDPKYSNNRLIRVTPEIVNVIGGYGTEDYDYFKKTCVKIYNRLRLHVNLFSNLLSIIPAIDQNITYDIIKRELTERFEIGENCIEAATHMDNKVGSKGNFEYMVIDFLYKSKQSTIFKGISYVTGSLMSMLSNKSSTQ